jgi:hypothetical protein
LAKIESGAFESASAAIMTVYTDADFSGASGQFGPDSEHPRLEASVSGRIESLELTCRQTSGRVAPAVPLLYGLSDSAVLR